MAKRDDFDLIVIGAGAAGLMAALTAAQRGKRVLVLEHNQEAGRKILISGGGRCNFTNLEADASRYFSANPSFAISALRRYPPQKFIALVEKHGIPYHEKKLGQLFCDGSARAIVAMLLAECAAANVEFRYDARVTRIEKSDCFNVQCTKGSWQARTLVIATGGLSIPKLGASGFAYDVARHFGVPVTELRPALVPLTLQESLFQHLAGVAFPVEARCAKAAFNENLLFTHRGLSGPAILQISTVWREGKPVCLDLLPAWRDHDALLQEKGRRPNASMKSVLAQWLPARFAEAWCQVHQLDNTLGAIRDASLGNIFMALKNWQVVPNGTEGYAKAEVTLGGVDTQALSSQTMMVKSVPGLFYVGEAVDVTGWLGGYNFQWAWASGWCAGMAV